MKKLPINFDQRIDKSAYNQAYHLINREAILERHKLYRIKNIDKIREYGRQHYWDNRDYYLKQASQYMKLHPQKAVDYVAKRRMLSYHNGKYEVIDRDKVYVRDGGICWICELPITDKWELDHVIPLSKGGCHTYDNIAIAHRSCNARKATKILDLKKVRPMPVEMNAEQSA